MYKITLFCLNFMAFTPFMCWALTQAQLEQIHDQFEKIGEGCIKDNPITPEDLENLRANKVPTSNISPCFVACMFKGVGILDDHGMMVHDNALDMAKKIFVDPEELKIVEEFIKYCGAVNDAAVSDGEKGCDRAILGFKCMTENASKFGFTL